MLHNPIPSINIATCRVNRTLHGRSVFSPKNVSGHNVVKGYNHPGTNDALDLFCKAGTPIEAMHDGYITRMAEPDGRLGALYLEGSVQGHKVCTVYAHLHVKEVLDTLYAQLGKGKVAVKAGQILGYVNRIIKDPHLHLEVIIDGKCVSGRTPKVMQANLSQLL